MSTQTVFLHGVGRAGAEAWPLQAASAPPEWRFLNRTERGDSPHDDAERILHVLLQRGSGHAVAHSFGAIAAVLAAQQRPDLVMSLTLFEPVCLDVARGKPTVEDHIAAMAPVFAVRDDPRVSACDFSQRFAKAMGTQAPDLPDDELEARVARLRALEPPWDTGLYVDVDAGLLVPTLVLTGGSRPLYEEIAEALIALGARHEVIPGFGHRLQDSPIAHSLMISHWATARTAGSDHRQ